MTKPMKVGELAARTGLTVRTLHHYDDIGLLTPSQRTPAGHRLYGTRELLRLQQIASLRHLGLSLEEIGACLRTPEYSLDRALELQLERLEEQMDRHRSLRDLIVQLRERLAASEEVSVGDLTRTIEITMKYRAYYSDVELRKLAERRTDVGEDRITSAQNEWTDLFAAFERARSDGLDPASPEVKILARKSAALIEEFTGGDPGIRKSLDTMYRAEGGPRTLRQHGMGMSPELWEYMAAASAAVRTEGA